MHWELISEVQCPSLIFKVPGVVGRSLARPTSSDRACVRLPVAPYI